MTATKKSELVELLKTILTAIGFTDIVNKLNKVTNTETCFFPESNVGDKTISFVVLNEEVASATRKRFGDWKIDEGIVVESTGKNNIYWKVTIPFRVLEKVKKDIETTKPHIPQEKTKERLYIEHLLFGKGIAPDIRQGEDDFWFTITFRRSKDCDEAKRLLTDANIDYDDSGGKTILFVLVSLPDALFKEDVAEESKVDQKTRHISEYYGRLILLLSKKLGFIIKHPYGPKHKGEKYVTISGDNGSRRLEFCGEKEKISAEIYLIEAGFRCNKPQSGEKHTMIIDLSQSTQQTLTQNIIVEKAIIETVTPTLEEPKQISITEKTTEKMTEEQNVTFSDITSLLKMEGYVLKANTNQGSDKVQYLEGEELAKSAAVKIQNKFPKISVTQKGKGIFIPRDQLTIKEKKGAKNIAVKKEDSIHEEASQGHPAEKRTSPTQLAIKLLAALKEEAKSGEVAELKAENKKLKETIKTLKAELKSYQNRETELKKLFAKK